jgi:uncharacterized integral membrane protein (TIGR00697 family)
MQTPKGYRLFHVVAMLSVATLLISNTIAVKLFSIGNFTFPAGDIVFPIDYIIGDVLTEVYGYERTRSVIWTGFIALLLMVVCYVIAVQLVPVGFWHDQAAFAKLFDQTPRIALGSFAGFLCGSFSNSFVLSKMKIWTKGKFLWSRTIGSTIVAEALDSIIFNAIAFYGLFQLSNLFSVMYSGFIFKVAFEIIATPLTYFVVNKLKRIESEDKFDFDANYNPLKF